jgi:hypothetical protein
MTAWRQRGLVVGLLAAAFAHGRADAGAEAKLGKDFLEGLIAKLPPVPFDKADRYRGTLHSYRLIAIEARSRRLLVVCQIEGQFHPPVTGPISDRVGRSPGTPEGWRRFSFEVKARVNIEPGLEGVPRFRIEIDDVKKRELDGLSGVVAKFLGQYFDELVTQIASGRASRLNDRLNGEVLKRIGLFKDYGVFCGIDYSPTELVLRFDLTRFRFEGIAGYVWPQPQAQPAIVPLYRWLHPRNGSHYYTVSPAAPDRPNSVSEGVACHVYTQPIAGAVPLYWWRNAHDDFYTSATTGEAAPRLGYRFHGIACYVEPGPKPGAVPLYRFFDPIRHHHFYTTHPHAEFAK